MTLYCADCGSSNIEDLAAPWKLGKVPVCPHCSALLYDVLGKPLKVDAERAWCHNPHRRNDSRSVWYSHTNWIWRDRAAYPDAYEPLFDARELAAAAAADPTDPPLDQEQR